MPRSPRPMVPLAFRVARFLQLRATDRDRVLAGAASDEGLDGAPRDRRYGPGRADLLHVLLRVKLLLQLQLLFLLVCRDDLVLTLSSEIGDLYSGGMRSSAHSSTHVRKSMPGCLKTTARPCSLFWRAVRRGGRADRGARAAGRRRARAPAARSAPRRGRSTTQAAQTMGAAAAGAALRILGRGNLPLLLASGQILQRLLGCPLRLLRVRHLPR